MMTLGLAFWVGKMPFYAIARCIFFMFLLGLAGGLSVRIRGVRSGCSRGRF